jgi:hypothetical protein
MNGDKPGDRMTGQDLEWWSETLSGDFNLEEVANTLTDCQCLRRWGQKYTRSLVTPRIPMSLFAYY